MEWLYFLMRTETKAVLHGGKRREQEDVEPLVAAVGEQQGIIATTLPGRALHGPACVQQLCMLLNGNATSKPNRGLRKNGAALTSAGEKVLPDVNRAPSMMPNDQLHISCVARVAISALTLPAVPQRLQKESSAKI